jgi:hypothetical protein
LTFKSKLQNFDINEAFVNFLIAICVMGILVVLFFVALWSFQGADENRDKALKHLATKVSACNTIENEILRTQCISSI